MLPHWPNRLPFFKLCHSLCSHAAIQRPIAIIEQKVKSLKAKVEVLTLYCSGRAGHGCVHMRVEQLKYPVTSVSLGTKPGFQLHKQHDLGKARCLFEPLPSWVPGSV